MKLKSIMDYCIVNQYFRNVKSNNDDMIKKQFDYI